MGGTVRGARGTRRSEAAIRRRRWVAIGVLVAASTSAACSASADRTLPATTVETSASTTSPAPTTTTTARPTTTTSLPPVAAAEGDPGSGNLTEEPYAWVDIRIERGGGTDRVIGTNHAALPMDVEIELTEAVDVTTDPLLPAHVTIAPLAVDVVLATVIGGRSARWSYQARWGWTFGDPAAVPDRVRYRTPFAPGQRAPVGQGPGGALSHEGVEARFAYDFTALVGTPVVAARGGTVATIDQGFTEGGWDIDLGPRANAIRVLHDDGTWAEYLHLAPRSARVRIGDVVRTGQVLALSGNTGRSSGPHLHFAVLANRGHVSTSLLFPWADR